MRRPGEFASGNVGSKMDTTDQIQGANQYSEHNNNIDLFALNNVL